MKPGREADRKGLLCAVAKETGVQPRSREDGQELWEEGGSRGDRKRDELGSEEEEARKDMPSKGTAWAKIVAPGKGMVYSEKVGPTGLCE